VFFFTFPASFFAMKELTLYIGFPLGVFLVHYLFLRMVMGLSLRKKAVALLNMILYPLGMSLLVAAFFALVSGKGWAYFLSSAVVGVVAYYFSLVLAFLPFLAPMFRELDMEFLLMGLGAALGVFYPSPLLFFKELGNVLSKHSLPLVLAFVVALVASTLVKYLISKAGVMGSERKEVLKNLAWMVSISAGVVSVPIIVFFLSLGKAS